ncbi:MAG: peptidylprolyl isomerase [Acidobacteriota bacterium]
MLRSLIFVGTALLAGCPSSTGGVRAPRTPEENALRVRIARAEAKRAAGVGELVELTASKDAHTRGLALRALGRVGGKQALDALATSVRSKDPDTQREALAALGLAVSLDDAPVTLEANLRLRPCTAAHPCAFHGRELQVATSLEGIGRAGGTEHQEGLLEFVQPDGMPAFTRKGVALAFARMARRKLAWGPGVRSWLAKETAADERDVRYATTYALAREHQPPADDEVNAALVARIADDDPEIRAIAIAGLSKRGAAGAGRAQIEEALHDKDWRVAVEAVRALAGERGDDVGRVIVAQALPQRLEALRQGNLAEAHVIIEALRLLVPRGQQLAPELLDLGDHVAPLARGWIECLAAAVDRDDLEHCGHGGLPDHLRLPILADLVAAGAQDVGWRRAAMRTLLAHQDARVRAAGLGALAATWKDGDDNDHRAIVGTLASALASPDLIVAGAAVDAAPAIYEQLGDSPDRASLDAALVARAAKEPDPELATSLYDLIGKRKLAAGADACRAGLAGHPVRARAAAECLRALGEAATAAPAAAAPAPLPADVDVTQVIGRTVIWHLTTTRGEIAIELHPDVAPWNVAAIVALARRGFYDHTEFHRVVPDFVVQGGDPTASGTGGPGFTLPAEPAIAEDGPGFTTGAVGIADAGRDSGGSQFFIMHAPAPHLDGRYTWIGNVEKGQDVADALLIGDQIVHSSVEVR